VNPYGARLNAMFSSDMGHWDVPDMSILVEEAYEHVERGMMSEEDFRDFMFGNATKLFGSNNSDFFKGTVVEADVARYLAASGK